MPSIKREKPGDVHIRILVIPAPSEFSPWDSHPRAFLCSLDSPQHRLHAPPMPITLGEHTVQRSRASWHKDEEINRRQAALLAQDVLATREKLLRELLVLRFGPDVGKRKDLSKRLHLMVDEGGVTWVTWREAGQKRPEAIAIFTHPRTKTQGCHLICEWHWKALGNDRN